MATTTSSVTFPVLLCAVIACFARLADADCFMIETSEGVKDLKSGQFACAPTYPGGPSVGKNYVQCYAGQLHEKQCAGILRWDMKNSLCNWPQFMDCKMEQKPPVDPNVPTTTPKPKVPCNETNCVLPDCFCYGATPEMNITDIPQFVMLTFDDGVTPLVFTKVYLPLMVRNRFRLYNPNQCPIKGAFFVSHWHTNYNYVTHLYNAGHEIASHSVNHKIQGVNTYRKVKDEIVGVRDFVEKYTDIPGEDIKGFRSPYLKIYGDVQYEVLSDYNFTYDSSLTNIEIGSGRAPLWPFTLDWTIQDDRCPNKPCPSKEHAGVWEIPMNGWIGNDTYSCPMIDGCGVNMTSPIGSVDQYYYYFKSNFDTFYKHKVPMHMFSHAAMFLKSPNALKGLRKFLVEILATYPDVWFVTPSQVIDWMQNPVDKYSMMYDPRFGCGHNHHV